MINKESCMASWGDLKETGKSDSKQKTRIAKKQQKLLRIKAADADFALECREAQM